jgi:hypothetical protein
VLIGLLLQQEPSVAYQYFDFSSAIGEIRKFLRCNFFYKRVDVIEAIDISGSGVCRQRTDAESYDSNAPRALWKVFDCQSEQPTRLRVLQGESPCAVNCLFGRLAYSRHAEVTKHEVLGRKSHCLLHRKL